MYCRKMVKKKYTKPEINIYKINSNQMIMSSTQCDCYEYRVHGGCQGCHGNCGCNHWDAESQTLVPGC